jgi:hypothetical protein
MDVEGNVKKDSHRAITQLKQVMLKGSSNNKKHTQMSPQSML